MCVASVEWSGRAAVPIQFRQDQLSNLLKLALIELSYAVVIHFHECRLVVNTERFCVSHSLEAVILELQFQLKHPNKTPFQAQLSPLHPQNELMCLGIQLLISIESWMWMTQTPNPAPAPAPAPSINKYSSSVICFSWAIIQSGKVLISIHTRRTLKHAPHVWIPSNSFKSFVLCELGPPHHYQFWDCILSVWRSLMPRSHQTSHPVLTMKLLGIMFRNRCWPTTFHTITAGDADGWCLNWLVWSIPQGFSRGRLYDDNHCCVR
jgi:hypothetical protein